MSSALAIAPGDLNVLPGFEKIKRYWDASANCWMAQVLPGEYYVSMRQELISTVLGSCVSTCIHDPIAKIGGLNHFMLPENYGGNTSADAPARYGQFALEQLINAILKYGGQRQRLEVKIFGGGKMFEGPTNIGLRNVTFARNYFAQECMDTSSEDVLGNYGRRLRYEPITGRAWVKTLRHTSSTTIQQREKKYQVELSGTATHGKVELF